MIGSRNAAVLAVAMAAMSGTSCTLFKKAAPKTPAARATKPPITIPESPKPVPPQIPPPDVASSEPADITGVPAAEIPGTKPGPVPKPPRRPSPPRRPTASSPSTPENASPAPGQAENVPQLRPILTPEQRQQLSESVTQRLDRAQRALRSIESRKLNRQQAAAAQQIRTFIRQAQDARNVDLIRANNLAERAEVLALDLLKTML